MAYQIYWIGGVHGYSTCRAYLQPGLYETLVKKAARLSDEDYRDGGGSGVQIVAVGESPLDHNRPSLRAWPAPRGALILDDMPF
jgi:hypothetical protein